jgi:hypothetical protein
VGRSISATLGRAVNNSGASARSGAAKGYAAARMEADRKAYDLPDNSAYVLDLGECNDSDGQVPLRRGSLGEYGAADHDARLLVPRLSIPGGR